MIPFASHRLTNVAALSGVGSPPPTFNPPFLIGVSDASGQTAATTQSFTTSADCPIGSSIVIFACPGSSVTLSGASGGGATWSTVTYSTYFAIFGAQTTATADIPAGTTITLTLSGSAVTTIQAMCFPGSNGTVTMGSFSDAHHVASGFGTTASLTADSSVTGPLWQLLHVATYNGDHTNLSGSWTYVPSSGMSTAAIGLQGEPNPNFSLWLKDSGTGTSTLTTATSPSLTISTGMNWQLLDAYIGSN